MRMIRKSFLGLFFLLASSVCGQWDSIDIAPLTPRDDAIVFTINDTAYLGTGLNPWFQSTGNFMGYTPSGQWLNVPSLPPAGHRQYACAWSEGQKGYVFGGVNDSALLNDLWIFDSRSQSWSEGTPKPSFGRSGAVAFVIDSNAYIYGGIDQSGQASEEVWRYHIPSDSWHQEPNNPLGARWRSSATVVNDTAYVIGGRDALGAYTNTLLRFSPAHGWNLLSTLNGPGITYTSLWYEDGVLFSVGGYDSTGLFHQNLESFDLKTNQWIPPSVSFPTSIRGGVLWSTSEAAFYCTGLKTGNIRSNTLYRLGLPITPVPIIIGILANVWYDYRDDALHFNYYFEGLNVLITNNRGQILYHSEDFDSHSPVSASAWSNGIYIVRSSDASGTNLFISKVPIVR